MDAGNPEPTRNMYFKFKTCILYIKVTFEKSESNTLLLLFLVKINLGHYSPQLS